MKIALLCAGLGHIVRGHEVFARDLHRLLQPVLDITLFKGGGEPLPGEVVVSNVERNAAVMRHVHVAVAPKWAEAVREEERLRIEALTFAYGALRPLLEGGYDIVHCLEKDVCNVVYDNRHVFAATPKVVFSNGGAMPAADLPRCDFVQEHTAYNLRSSDRRKGFMIPHGVDLARFAPRPPDDFRRRHGIPADAFLVISVGTICFWHKRMDHVIQEVALLENVHLLIVGQESSDSDAIKALGRNLLGDRVTFATLPHDELPAAYAAADVFVLGSLFETFGIAYIEAMAMQLPVVCTDHPNQRSIVQDGGVFVDMRRRGALAQVLKGWDAGAMRAVGRRGRAIVERDYDLKVLKQQYVDRYAAIASAPSTLPTFSLARRVQGQIRGAWRRSAGLLRSHRH